MNILRINPNIAKVSSVFLLASLGAVGCSTTEEAKILSTDITPVTEIHEWPLEEVENRPSSGFDLVRTINDDSYDCGYDYIDDEVECKWTYDDDYYGYNRRIAPIDSNKSTTLELDGREFAGSLESPPIMDLPENTGNIHYSLESYYEITLEFTTGDFTDARTCSGYVDSLIFDEPTIRKALSGSVTYSDSWGNKSIQFDRDGDQLLKIAC